MKSNTKEERARLLASDPVVVLETSRVLQVADGKVSLFHVPQLASAHEGHVDTAPHVLSVDPGVAGASVLAISTHNRHVVTPHQVRRCVDPVRMPRIVQLAKRVTVL